MATRIMLSGALIRYVPAVFEKKFKGAFLKIPVCAIKAQVTCVLEPRSIAVEQRLFLSGSLYQIL